MTITTTTSRMPSTKNTNGDIHFHQKVKGWFTRNSSNRDRAADNTTTVQHNANAAAHGPPRSDTKSAFRQTKFWTVGRLRSATTASEGNPLGDETLSPTALANPYFAHQGQPGLRHHNEGSVPPSPPDTPSVSVNPPDDDDPNAANEKATAARKEELARKLRRVASAPNAQGLFAKGAKGSGGGGGGGSTDDERPATAEMGKQPLEEGVGANALGFADSMGMGKATSDGGLAPPDADGLGSLPPPPTQSSLAFRRTYSSNSIKVRNVEVGPQSFDKIKLIGKGDVGKVYLVREKKSSRLYAMKGQWERCLILDHGPMLTTDYSAEQEGDDQAEQDQEGAGGAGDSGDEQSPVHCDALPLVPVRGLPLPLHGILQRRGILPCAADAAREVHIRGGRPVLCR